MIPEWPLDASPVAEAFECLLERERLSACLGRYLVGELPQRNQVVLGIAMEVDGLASGLADGHA